jgi:hypothetical protein
LLGENLSKILENSVSRGLTVAESIYLWKRVLSKSIFPQSIKVISVSAWLLKSFDKPELIKKNGISFKIETKIQTRKTAVRRFFPFPLLPRIWIPAGVYPRGGGDGNDGVWWTWGRTGLPRLGEFLPHLFSPSRGGGGLRFFHFLPLLLKKGKD